MTVIPAWDMIWLFVKAILCCFGSSGAAAMALRAACSRINRLITHTLGRSDSDCLTVSPFAAVVARYGCSLFVVCVPAVVRCRS